MVKKRVVPLVLVVAAVSVLLQGGTSEARTVTAQPSLPTLVKEATTLSNQVDSLGQQYDELQIEITHAKSAEKLAKQAAARAQQAMAGSQVAVAQLAAMGYMGGGLDPTLGMLTSGDPAKFLNAASTVEEIDNEAGLRVNNLQRDQLAAARAQDSALEEIATVNTLQKQINSKVSQIHAKLDVMNSSVMSKAMAIFDQTGNYPKYTLPAVNNVDTTALRYALTRRGDEYVWAAAGPDTFDCSGLVVWAYAQEGITLPHYTGDLWNSGMHVSRADLEPGDLVFFFADISHVGIYIGNGLMVDAPSTGQVVQVQPVFWDAYVGAVRIA
jgi:cell wall-associated NlpC family hydrolase